MNGMLDPATEAFVRHRDLLFTVAYEMLGSAADAEDVLQEAWLRWVKDDRSQVREPRAFLIRVVTRLALNRIRSVKRRREDYVGPWLPEPLATAPDPSQAAELAEQVSMALMVVLETLAPVERAVFVLRDVFGVPYEEIAPSIGKSAAAVRQIAHRARGRVALGRPRRTVSPAELRALLERFQRALDARSVADLLDVLSPDAVLVSDGGGVAPAGLAPIVGGERVAELFVRGLGRLRAAWSSEFATINGQPALLMRLDGRLDGVLAAQADGDRLTGLYYVRNPAKLGRVETPMRLAVRD